MLDPEQFSEVPAYDLLQAAARGLIGFDHRLLHALLDNPERSLNDIVRFTSEDGDEYPVDLSEDLISIFRSLRTPAAIPFLIEALRGELPEDAPEGVLGALVEIGAACIEPLLELCAELGEEDAGEASFCLALIGERDPRILQLLTERMEYDLWDAALSLEVYGDPAAIPALENKLGELPGDAGDVRRDVEGSIRALRQGGVKAKPEPFDIWELYPEKAGPEFDALSEDQRLELLTGGTAEYRADAAASFFGQEFSLQARAKLLAAARGDADPGVRGKAWEALLDLTKEREVRESMLAVLADPNTPLVEQGGALVGLAQHAELPLVAAAITRLYAQPEGRAKALETMWRTFDRKYASYFPKHLDDSDPEVKRHAIWGVAYCGIHAEAGRLRKFFEDEELRSDALFAYALVTPAEVSPGRMKALLRKIEDEASGMTDGEIDVVMLALDQRLALHDFPPVFFKDDNEEDEEEAAPRLAIVPPPLKTAGRNDPCPCGSGKKFKKCCGA